MACLSVYDEEAKIATVCANPIYLDHPSRIQNNATLSFTVMELDASSLKNMIGSEQLFVLESQGFWGKLLSLEPGLSLFGKPAHKGELLIQSVLKPYDNKTEN